MADSPRARILIVDDDPGMLRLVEKALMRQDFVATTANSGEKAVEWLTQNQADLMLLDLKLQDTDGKALISRLASIDRLVPFIIITGQGDERAAVEMMKHGALDYLVKDVQLIELVPTVARRALEQLEKDKRLAATQAELKDSQAQLLAVSGREQARFAAELHDGLGQQLTAIEMRCQSMKEDLPRNRPDLNKQLSEIGQFLREAIAQTRSLARDLSSVIPGSDGLVEALGGLAGRMSMKGRIQCTLDSPPSVAFIDATIAGHLFRIAQEAVNNAVKHSQATHVIIRLTDEEGVFRLEVSDNGKGFPTTPRPVQGIGLQIMKHRASVIGAALEIKSRSGEGVAVSCMLRRKL